MKIINIVTTEGESISTEFDTQGGESFNELRRRIKTQELQFKNDKLLLEHKNELLRKELLEVKEREINQAKLHESMFNKGKFSFLILSHESVFN